MSFRRWATPAAAALILVLALYLLHRELQGFTVAQILAAAEAIPTATLALAFGYTVLCYIALTGYDWTAVQYVGVKLPYRRVAFASFLGYAFSQALGFPLLTGAPPRYRLYSSWGLETPEIGRIIAFYSTTFWLGLVVLGGASFVLDAPVLPPALHVLGASARPMGVVFLIMATAYVLWCTFGSGTVRLGRWTLAVPSGRQALSQIVVATADWLAAAAVLYTLLPDQLQVGFWAFLGTFLLAQIVGFVSHVPAGLGVFEVVLLLSLPGQPRGQDVVASLVAYRVIYYIVPLVLAAISLGIYEFRQRRESLGRALAVLGPGVSSAVPVVLSGTVFLGGALLLATGALPSGGDMGWLGSSPPLALLEASHFLASLVGAGLLIVAWGLARRLDGAFHTTLLLLGAGAVLSAMRPRGLLTALVLLLVLLALAPARREFFRRSALTAEPLSPEWVFGVGVVLLTTSWLGFFAYREVQYSGDLWWRFALRGDAPRFLRSAVGACGVILAFAVARLLRPARPVEARTEPPGIPDAVPNIVSIGGRTAANLAFLGDKRFLMAEAETAFIMFGVEGRSWVSMGDPQGDPEAYPELVWRFRERAILHGGWPVFYQVRPEFLPLYIDTGLTLLKLGEEAVVPVQDFTLEGGARKGFRYTLRKAEKDGASFDVLPVEETARAMPRLKAVSDAWLAAKGTQEKGFSLGAFDEEYLAHFPTAVIRREGEIVAFANVWPGHPGGEYSVDLMRYHPDEAPTDAMEYLFLRMILWGKDEGFTRFNLGMAPLSGLEGGPLAPLWARMGGTVFRYGEHFYNFQGLRAYKQKFDPAWEPRYLASPGGLAVPRILGNVAALVSGGIRGALAR